jgi:ElaB/YqjD/DUF883 family membrane-anchored ribosome-binding protein
LHVDEHMLRGAFAAPKNTKPLPTNSEGLDLRREASVNREALANRIASANRIKIKRMKKMEPKPSSIRTESKPLAASGGQFRDPSQSGSGPTVSESVARSKDAIGAAANDAMSSAGSDLQALRADLNSLKDTVMKFVSQAGGEAAKSAKEVTSSVTSQVGGVATDLAGKGAEMASAASEQAKTFASELEGLARRNPLGAIAGAVVFGVLIGLMGRRN